MIKRTLFFGNKASLTTKNKQLIVKTEKREASIPIEDIGFIVIEHQETYISIPALHKLVANNAAVIICDDKHLPSGMVLNLDGHHIQQQLFEHQINASAPLKKQLWQQIVKEKILNQTIHLERLKKPTGPLRFYADKVLSGDTTNREGAAAKYYWERLFNFDFIRARNGIFPNLFLNYGYIILRAAVARALSGSGLLNTLGIHHHNKYNAFCLADDVMEPYRPLIDAKVVALIAENNGQELNTSVKAQLLEVLTQTVYFKDRKSPLMVALATTASSLQQCFAGKTRKIIYPKLWN
ncbi:MAG: type II CRISPR-associated endonuclease Cas1 [Bacteroidota bacterium]